MRDQMPALILSVYLPHFLLKVRGTMEVKGKCVETSNIAALLDSQKRELRVSLSTFPQRAILLGIKCVIVRGVWHRRWPSVGRKEWLDERREDRRKHRHLVDGQQPFWEARYIVKRSTNYTGAKAETDQKLSLPKFVICSFESPSGICRSGRVCSTKTHKKCLTMETNSRRVFSVADSEMEFPWSRVVNTKIKATLAPS